MGGLTVGGVCAALDRLYPPGLAEDWDRNGLYCGDPDSVVSSLLLAVDLTDEVITEAAGHGCELVVTHHPLLLRGIHSVARSTPKGRRLVALISKGMSAVNVHTPADSAPRGVSDAIAELIGLRDVRPLDPRSLPPVDSLVTFEPSENVSSVVGLHPSAETNVSTGIGRLGALPVPVPARELAAQLAGALPRTVAGLKVGGDPDRLIAQVAILAGAGDSHLDVARKAGADAFVTSDLRHHPAEEALAWDDAPVLIDVPHWACEWAWLPHAATALRRLFPSLRVYVSELRTEPWSLRV